MSKLKAASTGSPNWQQATSAVAAAHLELVRIQGGATAEGRLVKGEIPSLEEDIQSAEAEAVRESIDQKLAEIEGFLRDWLEGPLAAQLTALGYSRIDFQVGFDSASTPVVSVVRHGGGSRGRSRRAALADSYSPSSAKTDAERGKGRWNGEFYVSFGHDEGRSWDEARRYGFISGGGGPWYSKTLGLLDPGDRVWVNVPRRGYVGVGRVKGTAVIAKDFLVIVDGRERHFLEVAEAKYMRDFADDYDKAEYFVPVEWIETRSLESAISEAGFFGNQNTVCRPIDPKWDRTVVRLRQRFQV